MDEETKIAEMAKSHTTPKDFFLHLAVIVTLYISTVSFISLIFDLINTAFPDKLDSFTAIGYSSSVKLELACLIIIFPLYLLFSWLINRDIRTDGRKAELGVRRWLTSTTLFLAGLTLAIDLITLVLTFLNGEITVRFILKVIVVLVVAGAIFTYYLYTLRSAAVQSRLKMARTSGIISALVVLAAIVGSFVMIGSPFLAREQQFDEQRVSDLENIQSQIISYWQQNSALPASLSVLNNTLSNYYIPTDPESGAAYGYEVTSITTSALALQSFQLCAIFDTTGNSTSGSGYSAPVVQPAPASESGEPSTPITADSWQHSGGNVCFARTIDPRQYPPYPKTQ